VKPLSSDFNVIYRSPDPKHQFAFSPCILVSKTGRYIFSMDISDTYGKIYISDDKGETWKLVAEENFWHGSLFADGDSVYMMASSMAHDRNLVIMRSDDDGETWTGLNILTDGCSFSHCATDVWYKDGYVYVPMDLTVVHEGERVRSRWKPNWITPVICRGKLGTDLTKRENWLLSKPARFRDVIAEKDIEGIGVPFFTSIEDVPDDAPTCASAARYRHTYDFVNDKPVTPFSFHAVGGLESNVVQITDPKHYWYDSTGKTLHIFSRANTHGTGYCILMKAVERVRDGKEVIDIECEVNPSGKRVIFLPMPGGQNKFFVKYDEKTKLYWLASSQTRDSMTRIEYLSEDRYNIPSDERDRLVLHFSKNMVDWIFAGLVDKSGNERQSRHYASMDIDGDDLLILSRSGDEETSTAHDTNLVTLHRVKNFRDLVY